MTTKPALLAVDDEPAVLQAIERDVRREDEQDRLMKRLALRQQGRTFITSLEWRRAAQGIHRRLLLRS